MNTVYTQQELSAMDCKDISSPIALDNSHINRQLSVLPQWKLIQDSKESSDSFIFRTLHFASYEATLLKVNAIASIAQQQNHHPELIVNFDSCEIRFNTHSAKGISLLDFICAAKVDEL